MTRPFHRHQRAAFKYSLRRQGSALFMEMRLGKTLVAIRSVDFKGAYPTLVSAPFSTFYGWRSDLLADGIDDIVVLAGTRKQRLHKLAQGLADGARWYILNKEGHRVIPEVADVGWGSAIIDESTFIKNPQSKVGKYYTRKMQDVPVKYLLTGSPAVDGLLDYYQQLRFLDPDILGCRSYWEFRQKYFTNIRYDWRATKQGSTFIHRALAEHCFYMTREEAGLGGAKVYVRRTVQMTPKVRKAYIIAVREFVLEGLTDDYDDTIWATSRFTWLRKLCGGFAGDDFVFDAKYAELLYLLATELKGQQIVIWCYYLNELHLIHEKLNRRYRGKVGIIYGAVKQAERDAQIDAFRRGELRYMVIQPNTAKWGTDLSAADTEVFYSTCTGEARAQAEDRIIATGKLSSSLIIDITVEDSVDEDMVDGVRTGQTNERIHRNIINRFKEVLDAG
jgi:SNF2 domain-containing protein/helicase-like protein